MGIQNLQAKKTVGKTKLQIPSHIFTLYDVLASTYKTCCSIGEYLRHVLAPRGLLNEASQEIKPPFSDTFL
jgi:hypothetical protein